MGNFINNVINKVKGNASEETKEAQSAEPVLAEQVASNAQAPKVEPTMVDPKKSKHGGDVCCGSCGG